MMAALSTVDVVAKSRNLGALESLAARRTKYAII